MTVIQSSLHENCLCLTRQYKVQAACWRLNCTVLVLFPLSYQKSPSEPGESWLHLDLWFLGSVFAFRLHESVCYSLATILQFSAYFFSRNFYLWLYVRNILFAQNSDLIWLRKKPFLPHIFLVLSLNTARKIWIAVCTLPDRFGFPATSFPMHKIRWNLFYVPPFTISTSSKLRLYIK